MKRCWFALILLVALLLGSLWVTDYMADTHTPIAEAVGRAEEASLAGNWTDARQELDSARASWDGKRKMIAVFADHEPMEEADALFAQLEVAAIWQDAPGFSSLCAHLSEALKAMGEAHGPTWWNIL